MATLVQEEETKSFNALVPTAASADQEDSLEAPSGQPQEGKSESPPGAAQITPLRASSVARRKRRSRAASLYTLTKVFDPLFADCKDVNASLEDPIGRAYFIA